MTKLLISIRSAREAELVDLGKIGILDVKEPDRGGLGASDPETLREVAAVSQKANLAGILSFSAGELAQWSSILDRTKGQGSIVPGDEFSESPQGLIGKYGQDLLAQYRYVKVGLAGVAKNKPSLVGGETHYQGEPTIDWRDDWMGLFDVLPSQTKSVAVVYVDFRDCDAPLPSEIIKLAAQASHCEAVLFDTYYKPGSLFSHVSITELKELAASAQAQGLEVVVAGSVNLNCLADVVSLAPSYVGVRGAVCRGGRTSEVVPELVQEFVQKLELLVSS